MGFQPERAQRGHRLPVHPGRPSRPPGRPDARDASGWPSCSTQSGTQLVAPRPNCSRSTATTTSCLRSSGQANRRGRRRGPVPLRGLLAMHAGVAPVPVSSGRTDRHRLSGGGNRQLNAALHRIAITQLRLAGPGQAYYQRRWQPRRWDRRGRPSLKRRFARAIHQHLKRAQQALTTTTTAVA
jgi:hypothetical protein